MRKWIACGLSILMMCLPFAALAEEENAGMIFTGQVAAKNSTTVLAPFGGTVNDFTIKAGDRVKSGDALMVLDTTKVYAPVGGTVRGVFGQVGDSASYIQNRYGALCYIEPEDELFVQATTSGRYNNDENKYLHIGEKVYLRASSYDREGEGFLTALSGETYTIEITNGDLELRDSVNIFRDSEYDSESRIGQGVVGRQEAIAISAEGSIFAMPVRDGATVKRGDLLFELVSGPLDGLRTPSATIRAPHDGIVASISASPGQTASKNQALATVYRVDTMQLVSSVTEMDASTVTIGDTVRIVFDGISGKDYTGTIASISSLGTSTEDYTEYTVYIDFTPDEDIRLGMNATAYPDP